MPTACATAAAPRIARERLATWLLASRTSRVRLVCAPLGAGKSAALVNFAARRSARVTYYRLPAGADVAFVRTVLTGAPTGEVILDDADLLEPAALAALPDLLADAAPSVVLAGRSRYALGAHALLARGIATRVDPAVLALDAGEIARLADAYGVAYEPADLELIANETEGWALAAEWLVRDAAEDGRTLHDAPARWRERNGHLLLEFIRHERWPSVRDREAFFALLGGGWSTAQPELERLEALGFPLVRTRTGVRPYRLLARLGASSPLTADDRVSLRMPPPMLLGVLGRFRCEIGGRPVLFARRRDAQLFVYVALADGAVSRETLLNAFWPGADGRIAAQSLRTALSRIRRAIADAVPDGHPERYFVTDGDIRVERGTVAVDARRFVEQIEAGRHDETRGDTTAALVHYRNAHRVYAGSLLESEGLEACLGRHATRLDGLRADVLARLAALHLALGEREAAEPYERALEATAMVSA